MSVLLLMMKRHSFGGSKVNTTFAFLRYAAAMTRVLLILALLVFSVTAFSQSRIGKPDSSFGNQGTTQAGLCGLVTMLDFPDRSVLLVKQSQKTLTLLKLTRAGKWDTSFANQAVLRLTDWDVRYTQTVQQNNSDVLLVGVSDYQDFDRDFIPLRLVLVSAAGKVKFRVNLDLPRLDGVAAAAWVWSGQRLLLAFGDEANQRVVFVRYTLSNRGELDLDTSFATQGYAEFSVISPKILELLSAFGSGTPAVTAYSLAMDAAGNFALTGGIQFRGLHLFVAKFNKAGFLEPSFSQDGVDIDAYPNDIGYYRSLQIMPKGGVVFVSGTDNSPQGDKLTWYVDWFNERGVRVDSQGLDSLESGDFYAKTYPTGEVIFLDEQKVMLHTPNNKPRWLAAIPAKLEDFSLTTDKKLLLGYCQKNQLLIRRTTF